MKTPWNKKHVVAIVVGGVIGAIASGTFDTALAKDVTPVPMCVHGAQRAAAPAAVSAQASTALEQGETP